MKKRFIFGAASLLAVVTLAGCSSGETKKTEGSGIEESNESIADSTPMIDGKTPFVDEKKNRLTYGLYPQTRVSDQTLIQAIVSSGNWERETGWYLYEGEYYAAAIAKPYWSSYTFNDGETIVEGSRYWFKCEPIEWDISSTSADGAYTLATKVLLDTQIYEEFPSNGVVTFIRNYSGSQVKEWLEDNFSKDAFAYCDSSSVEVKAEPYVPSFDVLRDFVHRRCKPTDWARANGAWYSTLTDDLDYGMYWTTDESSKDKAGLRYIDTDGNVTDYKRTYAEGISVRPVFEIEINS